jgi:hypothetical protein
MTYVRFGVGLALLPLMLLALAGCSNEPKLPDLTEVEGVVLMNGQPLPFANVKFNPTKGGLPPNSIGIAVTDEAGKFKLMTAGKPGAVPGDHVVTVSEGPPPEDVRGEAGQEKLAKYQASLKNRPIPPKYGDLNKSDLRVAVKADQKEYKIELTRATAEHKSRD